MAGLTDIRQFLRDYCDRLGTSILTDALCDEFANSAQERMQQAHQWRGQEVSSAAIAYGSTDDGKALPAGFISEHIVSQEVTGATDPSLALVPLKKVIGGRQAWLLSREPTTLRDSYYPQTAIPGGLTMDDVYYYLWAEKIYVVPNPTSSINIRVDYYGMIAALTAGAPTNFFTTNYFRCLKWGALVEAWAFLHEPVREATADARFEKLLAKAITHDAMISMSGPPRVRGT